MTNQLGPPLTFKAVNTETGEEYALGELQFNHVFYNQTDYQGDGFVHTHTDQFEFKGNIEKLTILQSTGLHDSNGVEIFAGDCLKQLGEDVFLTVVWCPVDCEFRMETKTCRIKYINSSSSRESFTVIGNRWMPLEELERRARDACANKDEGGLRG